MKDFVQPIIDLVKTLLQREKGTKFLALAIGVGTLAWSHQAKFATLSSDIAIVVLITVYFVADIVAKIYAKPKTEEKPE